MDSFPLKELPVELREKIYEQNNMQKLAYDNKIPNFLLALASDEELYHEFNKRFRRINYNINERTEPAFMQLSLKQLFQYRHVKLVCEVFM